MRIFDISIPIAPGMHVYPGDPGFAVEAVAVVGENSNYALSRLTFGTHTGTHLDSPAHFFKDGLTVDKVPLETLVGPAVVVQAPDGRAVTEEFLVAVALPAGTRRVLFKTANGALWDKPTFQRRFVYIDELAAKYLVAIGVRLVGIDYLSAEQYGARQPVTHRALLGAGTVILEGIDLRMVPPGAYTLVCLPLKIVGGDGAPARAILIQDNENAG